MERKDFTEMDITKAIRHIALPSQSVDNLFFEYKDYTLR